MVTDVFENFRNMCLQIYQLDPAKFLSAPGLVWQAALRKSKVKLRLLTDINMLLMVEKGITGEICHSIYRYAKANNKYMKDYDKNKELSYVQYWNINDLYAGALSQKLPLNNFEWKKYNSQFNEDFICNYKEEGDEGFFFQVDNQYLEKLHGLHNNLPFYQKEWKLKIRKTCS